jgi:hypothetical protein
MICSCGVVLSSSFSAGALQLPVQDFVAPFLEVFTASPTFADFEGFARKMNEE